MNCDKLSLCIYSINFSAFWYFCGQLRSVLPQCKVLLVCARVLSRKAFSYNCRIEKQHEHTGPSDSTYSAYLIDFWAGRCLGRLNGRLRQRLGKVSSCAAIRLAKITINLGPVVVSHLGSATARLLAPESGPWYGWDIYAVTFFHQERAMFATQPRSRGSGEGTFVLGSRCRPVTCVEVHDG